MMAATMATIATVDTPPFFLTDPAAKLRRERSCPCPREREAEAGEHRQVDVKRDSLAASDAKRRQAVLVFSLPNSRSAAARPR